MHEPNDDYLDEELSGALTKHEDAPEPSHEHIEQLRKKIYARSRPAQVQATALKVASRPADAKRSHFPLRLSLVVAASILFISLFTMRAFVGNASASLRSSLDATRAAVWIHGATTVEHAGTISVAESWCSPVDRLFAFHSSQMLLMVDYGLGFQTSYSEAQGKIFQWPADQRSEDFGRAFILALLNDGDIKSSLPLHDVSDVRKSVGAIAGESTVEYSFKVQDRGNPSIRWETRVSTDPDTGRIVLWKDRHVGGMMVTTRFDYPAAGPRDIYQLGAPQAVEVVELGGE